ncbi:LmbE family N-acetylglucosaminyl deacetylase [Ulvibacter sp. MAR_2010_11]|uniref:PIG-L deacetylase family protein n=1 Tax=Ulvibacter sp. MAR_2010_11 TaxID=1250229 RepID=UPI000C2B6C36|nr:PIG-L family deacetylase [Ulvibacter sp. MAR_2010_11]PKA81985.1 LmbE family N-acetylglucosaminyl deacetylase [Ulvibacter sp. MAR_2010_11]
MQKFFLLSFLIGFISCNNHKAVDTKKDPNTIMAILAHPDDEAAFGQILAKYAAEGKKVYLVIAADGRYGVEEHAGIPAGDTLALVRKNESICACKVLGIDNPIFLELHDGFGLLSGLGEYFDQTAQIKEKVTQIVQEVNPDVILTFGPDGDTGHVDHKGIGDLVTEVILKEGWYEKYPLFFLTWPKEKEVSIPQGQMTSLNYVDKDYMNVHIKYREEDRRKLFKSLDCYKSQLTEDDVKNWIEAELKDTTFTIYFRQFITDKKVRSKF